MREAGVTVAIGPSDDSFAPACRSAGLTPAAESSFVHLPPDQIHRDVAPAQAVLQFGTWPGVRSGPNVPGRGIEVATASREPWVDANSYLVAYLQGLYPKRPALLGYRPDAAAGLSDGRAAPFESLELALVEAVAAGGNFVLTLPDDYRAALLRGDAKALPAWNSLGQTVRFLRDHSDWFSQPSRARVACAAGTLDQSGEILRLMFRRNLCPVVLPAASLPPLDPTRFRGLVRANLPPPSGPHLDRLQAFARAGGTIVSTEWVPPAAVKTRADEDRDHYSLGKGRIVAYRAPVADPSEFALDVIDLLGVRTRDLRLWNASAVLGLLSGQAKPLIHLINYGAPLDQAFPARVDGLFRAAQFWEPGVPGPRRLPAARRGSTTEITVDRLRRFAVITLD